MNDSVVKNLQLSLGKLSFTALTLEDFASKLIAHGLVGGKFDDASLEQIQRSCIRDLKNSHTVGVAMEDEIVIFTGAIEIANQEMSGAVQKGKELAR
jgi:aspartate/methionine/tyrosine aminotransferase